MCENWRTTWGVIPQMLFLCFETGSLPVTELLKEVRMADKPYGTVELPDCFL